MDRRDRELLAALARVNTEIGKVTIELLTLQPSDEHYAAALRALGRDLVAIGARLAVRAADLDGKPFDQADTLTVGAQPARAIDPHTPGHRDDPSATW
ncbi:hypothetical protein [Amycolatopsis japonica]